MWWDQIQGKLHIFLCVGMRAYLFLFLLTDILLSLIWIHAEQCGFPCGSLHSSSWYPLNQTHFGNWSKREVLLSGQLPEWLTCLSSATTHYITITVEIRSLLSSNHRKHCSDPLHLFAFHVDDYSHLLSTSALMSYILSHDHNIVNLTAGCVS